MLEIEHMLAATKATLVAGFEEEKSTRVIVPAEIVPPLQPHAVREPAMLNVLGLPFTRMSKPATENVYVPFKLELLNPPVGGDTGVWVLLPPHPTRKARPNIATTGRKARLQKDIDSP